MSLTTTPVIRIQVPFDEADGEGIVFFGNYFRLAHRALEQYLPQIGIPWEEWFRHPEYGVPLRHVEADYAGPLRPGDSLEIRVQVSELGESSVQFAFEFWTADQAQPNTQVRTAHVFASRTTRKKIPVPESIRARLQSVMTRSPR
jgi:YbgC/YbaW family acyl-CoA thioester hydrolase